MNWVIYSKFAVLIGFSMFLGFLSAIPVGAVQVDVAKKAINGHLLPALAVAAALDQPRINAYVRLPGQTDPQSFEDTFNIQAFFDSIDREKLLELLQIRVADPPLLRLIGKCLHV